MAQVTYLGLTPYCFQPTSDGSLVGSGTNYPVGFSINDVAALYWKTKSIKIEVDITINETSTPPPHNASGSISYVKTVDSTGLYGTISDETGLVCGANCSTHDTQIIGSYTINGSTILVTGTINFYIFESSGYYYNNLYYPYLGLFIHTSNQGSGQFYLSTTNDPNINTTNAGYSLAFSYINASGASSNITIPCFGSNPPAPNFTNGASSSSSITPSISVVSTWQYNP